MPTLTSDTVPFDHKDCEHFEPIADGDPCNHGNCAHLAEHLRLGLNTPVVRVVVDGDEQCAEVWLNEAGAQSSIRKGCPFFQVTTDALDELAEQLQSPTERGW